MMAPASGGVLMGRHEIFKAGHAYRVTHDFENNGYAFVDGEFVRHYPNPAYEDSRTYCLLTVGPAKYWKIPEGKGYDCWTEFFEDYGTVWAESHKTAFKEGGRYRARRDFSNWRDSQFHAGETVIYRRVEHWWRDCLYMYEFEAEDGARKFWTSGDELPPEAWEPFFEDLQPEIASPLSDRQPVDHTPKPLPKGSRARRVRQPRKPRWARRILWLLTTIGFAPLVTVLLGIVLAAALGCRDVEVHLQPCMAFGVDIGWPVRTLLSTGSFLSYSSKVAVAAVIGWIVLGLVMRSRGTR
jgi:hypothetical protein